MTATVTPLHHHAEVAAAAQQALTQVHHYLDRCKLATNSVTAYRRQTRTYVAWLTDHADQHPDAFADRRRRSRSHGLAPAPAAGPQVQPLHRQPSTRRGDSALRTRSADVQ